MEVEIISKEFIKPCSTTPSHLRTYKVSLLDQFMPPIFFSTALFYPDFISQKSSTVLKHSLSKLLSHYYPLAGRIKDSVSIDCNDEGAYYAKAKSDISMSEYLTQPDLNLFPKLVPDVSSFHQNPIGAPIIFIQETTFSCGGLAIGLSVSHIVFDGPSLAYFIKSWSSAAASSGEKIPHPNFDSRSLFPMYEHGDFPKEALITSLCAPFAAKEIFSMNRLVFDSLSVDKLKSKVACMVENPTRVEVVSAIITKSVKDALNAKSDIIKPIVIGHVVNLRRKAMPPFPDSSLGNFTWPAHAMHVKEETDLSSLVYDIRKAIRKLDNEFVKNAIEGGSSKLLRDLKKMGDSLNVDEMELMLFNSWCNFGLYNNSDFGFGKPAWISLCNGTDTSEEIIPINNMGTLMDTRNGDGVEVWLFLPQDIASILEKDDELLQYASFNLFPLNIP